MEEKLVKIEIMGTPVKLEDGTEFVSFKAFTKKGRMDIKFTKECKNVPTKSCYIYVEETKMNVNRKNKFPVIWVQQVSKIEEFPDRTNKLDDLFDM